MAQDNYSVLNDYRALDYDKWDKFVSAHINGNIFHTPEMVMLYKNDQKQEPIVVAYLNAEDEILGLLVGAIQREYNGILGILTARIIIWGGPLVTGHDPVITNLLLSEFDKLCSEKAVYSQFRNLFEIKHLKDTFQKQGYIYQDHLDILFNLELGEEKLWHDIHPTRRKQINRGIKRNIQTQLSFTLQAKELESCYSILKLVYKEVKLPFPDLNFFRTALRILGPKGYFKAVLARYEGEIVGFRFFLDFNGVLYDWYAGSRPEHYDKYPNDILPWEIIKWGASNGRKVFDFGGAGKPGVEYGVRDYKLKFGGKLVNYGRFEKIYKPSLMRIAKTAFHIWKLLK
jgi:serine/alanine adding enzyme